MEMQLDETPMFFKYGIRNNIVFQQNIVEIGVSQVFLENTVCGYALMLTNEVVSIKSHGLRQLDSV